MTRSEMTRSEMTGIEVPRGNRHDDRTAFGAASLVRAAVAILVVTIAGVSVASAEDLQIVLSGSCPGDFIVTVVGANPDQPVNFYASTAEGSSSVESGACVGTQTGLADAAWIYSGIADQWGGYSSTLDLPAEACGSMIQAIAEPFCEVSTVERIVSGIPAPVARTGQDFSWAPGDDGDFRKGVPSPDPRFTDRQDGTVTDNLTGIVWLKDADCFGQLTWYEAIERIATLGPGECGLSARLGGEDGPESEPAWRLPNLRELQSLVDYSNSYPPLPDGHPFVSVVSTSSYWSSTTMADYSNRAWLVTMTVGSAEIPYYGKDLPLYIWPVRGGDR